MRELVILFADLTGSTSLYEKLGDAAAKDTVHRCLMRLTAITLQNRGKVIKTLGDEIMTCFASADAAATAAVAMQQESLQHQGPCTGFSFRIGFHFGPVIDDANDVFGDAVNTAARLTSNARSGQILTSQPTVARLSPALALKTRAFDFDRLKGKAQPMQVFEMNWEDANELTDMQSRMQRVGMGSEAKTYQMLHLYLADKTVRYGADDPPLTMGRSATCGLVVLATQVSREHARCEYRRGKFVLTDQSANGSYVMTEGQSEVFLRRESVPLVGRGLIGLGAPLKSANGLSGPQPHIVRFESE